MKETLLKLALATLLVFAPIKSALVVVMLLVAVDLWSGIWAAKKRGDKITSTGLKRTVVKLLVYEGVITLTYLVEHFLTGPFLPLVNIMAGYIGITELKSVLENIEEVTGIDVLKNLISKLTQADPP